MTAALLTALVIGGCADGGAGGEEPLLFETGGVSHVHGLAVDPRTDGLYAATHDGVFRIEDGDASLIGAARDTMGLTITEDGLFLASGHPAFRADPLYDPDKTPLLGLIESTDDGRTWTPVSLFGEADFHVLRVADGRIFGADSTSGQLMVSTDGSEWEARSRISLTDFVVDPHDLEHLVASTDAGLVESRDGGRSWSPVPAPALLRLSWETDQLWGIAPDGAVHVLDGDSWQQRDTLPGEPEAIIAADAGLFASVGTEGGSAIFRSEDRGRSWELHYRSD